LRKTVCARFQFNAILCAALLALEIQVIFNLLQLNLRQSIDRNMASRVELRIAEHDSTTIQARLILFVVKSHGIPLANPLLVVFLLKFLITGRPPVLGAHRMRRLHRRFNVEVP
jgi:hypothetical protein